VCSVLAPSGALRIQLVLERLWLAAGPTADRAFCKLQKVPASFLRGKRDRKKEKRREDRRSLLKDMRILALSAYAHQFKILLGRIALAESWAF
jgi:hypothetical protein